jgi:ABC-2 type transport system ATP-binding protein
MLGGMAVIEAEELRRTYKTTTGVIRRKALTVDAVRGVSFSVESACAGPPGPGRRPRSRC